MVRGDVTHILQALRRNGTSDHVTVVIAGGYVHWALLQHGLIRVRTSGVRINGGKPHDAVLYGDVLVLPSTTILDDDKWDQIVLNLCEKMAQQGKTKIILGNWGKGAFLHDAREMKDQRRREYNLSRNHYASIGIVGSALGAVVDSPTHIDIYIVAYSEQEYTTTTKNMEREITGYPFYTCLICQLRRSNVLYPCGHGVCEICYYKSDIWSQKCLICKQPLQYNQVTRLTHLDEKDLEERNGNYDDCVMIHSHHTHTDDKGRRLSTPRADPHGRRYGIVQPCSKLRPEEQNMCDDKEDLRCIKFVPFQNENDESGWSDTAQIRASPSATPVRPSTYHGGR